MGDGAVLYTTEWCSHDRRLPSIELAEAPVDANFVANIEDLLQGKVSSGTVPAMIPEFPISQKSSNKMGKSMLHELQESWKAHHENPESSLSTTLSALIPELNNILTRVKENRVLMETYLLESIENARSDWRDKLLKTVNRVARPTIVDLLRLAVDPDVLVQLAPRLSLKSRGTIQMANLTFMQLCVLEDKLERVISRSQANSLPSLAYFVEELTCQRSWECRNRPYWLVFEVEGRLQIRPEQHYIVEELIYNPGKVCQLNMGRGKTRVILPMLFLYHSYETRGKIARARFLSPLLCETRQFMHRVLSAGVLRLPFIEQPFERQTELSLMDVLRMQEAVDDVKQFGGFQIIASEHRLSLELRRLELSLKDSSDDATNQEIIAALDKLLDDEQYINIFDESDAVLHHKYHFVYAIGDATELDGGTERWIAAEALLRVLVGTESKRLQRLLGSAPDLWSGEPDYVERAGAYDGLRLKTEVERLKTLVEWHYERR